MKQLTRILMKPVALSATIFFVTVPALANDGGTPYIKVDSVGFQIEDNQPTITIKGGDADNLYQILPQDFVFDVSRSLTITSKKKSVRISCAAQSKDGNFIVPVRDPKTTECTIILGDAYDPSKDDGDPSKFVPVTCEK